MPPVVYPLARWSGCVMACLLGTLVIRGVITRVYEVRLANMQSTVDLLNVELVGARDDVEDLRWRINTLHGHNRIPTQQQ